MARDRLYLGSRRLTPAVVVPEPVTLAPGGGIGRVATPSLPLRLLRRRRLRVPAGAVATIVVPAARLVVSARVLAVRLQAVTVDVHVQAAAARLPSIPPRPHAVRLAAEIPVLGLQADPPRIRIVDGASQMIAHALLGLL
jgi:hypothetical protein